MVQPTISGHLSILSKLLFDFIFRATKGYFPGFMLGSRALEWNNRASDRVGPIPFSPIVMVKRDWGFDR